MAKGNFDEEIQSSMRNHNLAAEKPGVRPRPMSARAHNEDAIAHPPGPPHENTGQEPLPHEQTGTQQSAGVPAPHMGGPQPGGGLQAAHATIVNALAQRDMQGTRFNTKP